MGEPLKTPRTPTIDLHNIFYMPKSVSLKEIGKVYKNLVTRRHSDKSSRKEKHSEDPATTSPGSRISRHYGDEDDDYLFTSPAILSRSASRRSKTPTPSRSYLSRNPSRRSITPNPVSRSTSTSFTNFASESERSGNENRKRGTSIVEPSCNTTTDSLSRSRSRTRNCASEIPILSPSFLTSENDIPAASLSRDRSRRSTTPIIFSQSTVRKKPMPIEKKLECTLENLYFGCVKKLRITRDVIKPPGVILQEDEVLQIEVKPGWRKGTKITFEEKGNEEPGYLPADIIFSIEEKKHPLFTRDGNDLEVCVEIPLVNALTGCIIPVPMVEGETMNVSFENIVIYPGYVKVIQGKGMPDPKHNGRRGELRVKFLIDFPKTLSEEQKQEVVSILHDCN